MQILRTSTLLPVITVHAVELHRTDHGELRHELSLALVNEVLSHAAPVARFRIDVCAVEVPVEVGIDLLSCSSHLELFVLEGCQDDRNLLHSNRLHKG